MNAIKLKSLVLLPFLALSLSFSESQCETPVVKKGPPQPKAEDPVISVQVAPPRFLNKARTVSGIGLFEASDKLVVKAPLKGVIDKSLLNVGDSVHVDDVLCVFRGEELALQVQAKQNELKDAQAELDSYRIMLQDFNTTTANQGQTGANTNEEPFFLDEEAPSHVVPPKPLGVTNPKPVANKAELENRIHDSELKIDTLTKALTTLEDSIKGLTIKATIPGIITKREVTDGSIVELGDTLFEIVNLDPITLSFFVPQEVTSYVDKNVKVSAHPTSAPEIESEGIVFYVSPAIDPVKHMLELKAHLPNANGLIKEGQEGLATVSTRRMDQVWVIPKKAVVSFEGKNYVFVQTGSQARKTEVVLGDTIGSEEITADANLRVDDLIVTSPLDQIHDGTFIKVETTTQP